MIPVAAEQPHPLPGDHVEVAECFYSPQGEGPWAGRPCFFIRFGRCDLDCPACFAPETPILMPDWSWRPLGELKPGDVVMGRTMPSHGKHGVLAPATVVSAIRRPVPALVNVDGLLCTPDHKFWDSGGSRWAPVENMGGKRAAFLASPPKRNEQDYQIGWLAGMADGDGCFWDLNMPLRKHPYRRFRLALNVSQENILRRFDTYCNVNGFYPYRLAHAGTRTQDGGRARHGEPIFASSMPASWITKDEEARRFEGLLAEDGESESWWWGYLGGILDAEGSLSENILRISQSRTANLATCYRIERCLVRLGLSYAIEEKAFNIHSFGQTWRVLINAAPCKWSFSEQVMGRAPNHRDIVPNPVPVGPGEVVTLTTTTGSFVAGGWIVKNCDTKYTWRWQGIYEEGPGQPVYDPAVELTKMSVQELVNEAIAHNARRAVITGGEPMLQRAGIARLAAQMRTLGIKVAIETNGRHRPITELIDAVDLFVVSPKLPSFGIDKERGLKVDTLKDFVKVGRDRRAEVAFKFVATGPESLAEVDAVVEEVGIPPELVWVMPEGTSHEAVSAGLAALVGPVLERGWAISGRLHVAIWGNQRGV